MKDLKITENLPNTKDWANTATRILKELIDNHNKLVEMVSELQTWKNNNSNTTEIIEKKLIEYRPMQSDWTNLETNITYIQGTKDQMYKVLNYATEHNLTLHYKVIDGIITFMLKTS